MQKKILEPKIYEGAVVQNCDMDNGVVIGEDTYAKDCTFGKSVRINRRNYIQNVSMGDYSYTGHNTTIKYADIGKFSSISWNVSIGGANHNYERMSTHPFYFLPVFKFVESGSYDSYEEKLSIGNDVWIGSGVQILRGVTVGDGAIIGAGSVVTKSVPPYAIAVGNPASVIKYRFSPEIIDRFMSLKWWDWDQEKIEELLPLFKEKVSVDLLEKIESFL